MSHYVDSFGRRQNAILAAYTKDEDTSIRRTVLETNVPLHQSVLMDTIIRMKVLGLDANMEIERALFLAELEWAKHGADIHAKLAEKRANGSQPTT